MRGHATSFKNKKYAAVRKHILESSHYFQLLAVSRSSGMSDIKRARNQLAGYVHPDVNSARDAHELMARVNVAAETLLLRQKEYLIELYSEGLRRCAACGGRGFFTAQAGFNHTNTTACHECHGAGLI